MFSQESDSKGKSKVRSHVFLMGTYQMPFHSIRAFIFIAPISHRMFNLVIRALSYFKRFHQERQIEQQTLD